MYFWYLEKSDMSSVHMYSCVHWISHLIQVTRKTRPCSTGQPVNKPCSGSFYDEARAGEPEDPAQHQGQEDQGAQGGARTWIRHHSSRTAQVHKTIKPIFSTEKTKY